MALDSDNQRWLPLVFWGVWLLIVAHGYVNDEANVAFNRAETVEMGEQFADKGNNGSCGKGGDDGAFANALEIPQTHEGYDHGNHNHGAIECNLAFGEGLFRRFCDGKDNSFSR